MAVRPAVSHCLWMSPVQRTGLRWRAATLTGSRKTVASMSKMAALPCPCPAGIAAAFAPETAPSAAAPTRIAAFFLTELIRTIVWKRSMSDPNDDQNGCKVSERGESEGRRNR